MSEQEASIEEFTEEDGSGDYEDDQHVHPRFGVLPSDWDIREIREVAKVVGGSTPSTNNDNYWGGEIAWATPTDITELAGNTIKETDATLTAEGLDSASTHLLPPYSVLMTSRATIGKCAVNTVEMATNQGFQSLIPQESVGTWYLHYRMLKTASFLESLGAGSTFDEVSKSVVQSVDIPVPPLEEQRKIASVLYTVDQAIQKTKNIREQYERLIVGTRRKLLREGIGLDKAQQNTPTGAYPEAWNMVRTGNHVELRNGEFLAKDDRTEDGDYPVYGGNGIMGRTNDHFVGADTVIIGRVGAYCGNVHVTDQEAWVTDNAIIISELSDSYRPSFIAHLLDQIGLGQFAEQSAQPRISQSTVENMRIPMPPSEEQRQIVQVLSSLENSKKTTIRERRQLEHLKQGLMQDLLSGEVRTHDKNIEIAEEVLAHG